MVNHRTVPNLLDVEVFDAGRLGQVQNGWNIRSFLIPFPTYQEDMTVHMDTLKLRTRGENDIIDITERVDRLTQNAPVKNGVACLFCPGIDSCPHNPRV